MTDVERALDALRAGEVIVVPTDTVYGIAAVPSNAGAVGKVFGIKGRPAHKPLPVLASSISDLQSVAAMDSRARRLGVAFWPGPLTLVLPRAAGFGHDLGGTDERSIAVRIPDHDLARLLLERSGPLAVTSANLTGETPATTVQEARAVLGGKAAVYLDGGRCVGGEASTVVSLLDGVEVLREGPVREGDVIQTLTP